MGKERKRVHNWNTLVASCTMMMEDGKHLPQDRRRANR